MTNDDINKIKGIAVKTYNRYYVYGITVEDLASEGAVAFIKAWDNYNPEKNNYFWGFAYKKVQGSMIDYIRKQYPKATNECSLSNYYSDTFTYNVVNDIDNEIDITNIEKLFMLAIEDATVVEQGILYDYFITGLPVYKIAKKYSTKNFKIKYIIKEVSIYLKEVMDGY